MPGFCRDCLADAPEADARCRICGSPRLVHHPRIDELTVAHVDCDAFYAAIEKRDNPSLADKPVIVGGGRRGVVATACYIARTFGVHSAMPMFRARKLCPDAVVIHPNMEKYGRVGREIRARMLALTPLVEPISIDEAFMDLSGTSRLHGMSPAKSLARFARRIESELGLTVSIGLSENKFLAKIASDLDKPRGFSVLDRVTACAFLAPKPVHFIWGIGKATAARLAREGFSIIGDLQRADETELMRRYGAEGLRLSRLSRGIDLRSVTPDRAPKSISTETTFESDLATFRELERHLWSLTEKVAARLKSKALAGTKVTLKLKTASFRVRTRVTSLPHATALTDEIFAAGRRLLVREIDGTAFRLIGIGVSHLGPLEERPRRDLIEPDRPRRVAREAAIDRLRARFGPKAVIRGLVFEPAADREDA